MVGCLPCPSMRRLSVVHVDFSRRRRVVAHGTGVEAPNWFGSSGSAYPGFVGSSDRLPTTRHGQQATPDRKVDVRRPQYEQAGPIPLDTERDAADLAHEVAGLRQALATRNIIGQAQGILIERHGTDSDRAFAMLVQLSQQSHLKLHEVARRLIETTVSDKPAGK